MLRHTAMKVQGKRKEAGKEKLEGWGRERGGQRAEEKEKENNIKKYKKQTTGFLLIKLMPFYLQIKGYIRCHFWTIKFIVRYIKSV